MVTRDVHLVNFAQRQVTAHVGQGAQDASVARGHATAQGTRDEEVAHEHCHVVAPHIVDGGLATALGGLVDDIIVDERGIVQHLEGSGALQRLVVDAAKELGAQQRDDRSQELAFVLEVGGHNAVSERAVTGQRGHDDLIEGVQFGPQLLLYMFQRCCHCLQR